MSAPASDRYQNSRGTTLCLRRSDAIHWTMKRAEKRAWPRRPTPTHTCSVVMRGAPFVTKWLRGLSEHRAQDVVRLPDVLGTPPAGHEREDLLRLFARHGLVLVRAHVGEIAQRDFERDGHAIEAVD